MATIKYYAGTASDMRLETSAGTVVSSTDTTAELMTGWGSDTAVVTGQGLTAQDDKLVAGTATEIVYKAFDSNSYRITDIEFTFAADKQLTFFGDDGLFSGNDTFIGSRGNDVLMSGEGKDFLRGGWGHDIVRGGEGNDTMRGGCGHDAFVFQLGDGKDTILDFDTKGRVQDVIRMFNPDDIQELNIFERHHSVVIQYGEGDQIILRGVDLDDLSHKNFDSFSDRQVDLI